MINKRGLDKVIGDAIYAPEEDCAYTFEEYRTTPFYQEHVCGFVRDYPMPYILAEYLYKYCYYDDIETVKANLNYINLTMPKIQFYESWVDMTFEMVMKEIEVHTKKAAEKEMKDNEKDDLEEFFR
jgi:hypothetical protein